MVWVRRAPGLLFPAALGSCHKEAGPMARSTEQGQSREGLWGRTVARASLNLLGRCGDPCW